LVGALSACDVAKLKPAADPTTAATATVGPEVEPPLLEPALTLVDPVARGMTVEGVTALCDDNLAIAAQIIANIKALASAKAEHLSWRATMGRLDDAFLSVFNASEFPYLIGVGHPQEAVRNAARACETKTDKLMTSIWLDAELAEVLKRYAAKGEKLSAERQRFVTHTLRDFRRNGIELPAAKQERLREINKEITQLGQRFIAEISASKGSIRIKKEQLGGLPEAYVKAHPPDRKGWVRITTDYPDYYPFVKYALDRKSAKTLYAKFVNRGGDVNVGRLDRLLALRHEKARLLGYDNWADYAIEPRMAKNAREAQAFLERVSAAIKPAVEAELKEFRAEYARLPIRAGRQMLPSDRYFLTERLKQKRFKFDSKELANYFEIRAVTKGLLDITAKMYGIQYKTVTEPTWHPEVTVHEVWSGDTKLGKFFLDLHSRDHKYKHAAMFTVRSPKVLAGGQKQTPIAALMCNFPRPGEPMPHDQVVTYFHEFGHVLHHLLTTTELASFAGTNTARDFVETPSQMFEEWAWSRQVLDLFATHRDTKAQIPDALFDAMTKSRRFGMALATERQLFLARLDLSYHMQKPGFDTTKLLQKIHADNFSFAYVPGTHFQSSFGHLIGYDAGYYGYQWALALAHDVLSRFKREGLSNPKTAADWRNQVLSKGGSANERGMIKVFLGREPTEQAYGDFLRGK